MSNTALLDDKSGSHVYKNACNT